jgi:hypothetical protein
MEVGIFSARQAAEYMFSSPNQGRRMANLCCIPMDGHEDVFLRRPTRGQLFPFGPQDLLKFTFDPDKGELLIEKNSNFCVISVPKLKDNGDAYYPGVLMRNKVCVELSE